MNCRECQEQIARAARAGAAPQAVFDHLARCPRCRRFAAQTVEVTAALAHWVAPMSDSTAAREGLVRQLSAAHDRSAVRGSERPAIRRRLHPAPLAARSAAALFVGAGL